MPATPIDPDAPMQDVIHVRQQIVWRGRSRFIAGADYPLNPANTLRVRSRKVVNRSIAPERIDIQIMCRTRALAMSLR